MKRIAAWAFATVFFATLLILAFMFLPTWFVLGLIGATTLTGFGFLAIAYADKEMWPS